MIIVIAGMLQKVQIVQLPMHFILKNLWLLGVVFQFYLPFPCRLPHYKQISIN